MAWCLARWRLLDKARSADVLGRRSSVVFLNWNSKSLNRFCREHPEAGQRIMRNLALLLDKRLILANAKVDLLSAY